MIFLENVNIPTHLLQSRIFGLGHSQIFALQTKLMPLSGQSSAVMHSEMKNYQL